MDQFGVNNDDIFQLIKVYLRDVGLASQQKQSFDKFIQQDIQSIIDRYPNFKFKSQNKHYTLKYGKFFIKPPMIEHNFSLINITPNECRLRGLNYGCPIYVEITTTIEEFRNGVLQNSTTETKPYNIGHLPVMVGSQACVLGGDPTLDPTTIDECPYDKGGYFIVGGGEKVVVGIEQLAFNKIYVFPPGQNGLEAEVRSYSERYDKQTTCKVRWHTSKEYGRVLRVVIPYVNSKNSKIGLPIGIIFKALGVIQKEEIIHMIANTESNVDMIKMIQPSLAESADVKYQNDAMNFIAEYTTNQRPQLVDRLKYIRQLLYKEFLNQIDDREGNAFIKKAYYLGFMTHKLLRISMIKDPEERLAACDNRDHLANKRIETCGTLLGNIFTIKFRKMHNDMLDAVSDMIKKKKDFNLETAIKKKEITSGISYALKNGRMSGSKGQGNSGSKQGTSQVLNRMNYCGTLSHTRRLTSGSGGEGRNAIIRYLDNTHYQMYCPAETPEGGSCLTLDTPIATPQGEIPIGELKDGDTVFTVHPETFDVTTTQITRYFQVKKPIFEIVFQNGTKIRATADHPFLVRGGFKELQDLTVQDEVLSKLFHWRKRIRTKKDVVERHSLGESPSVLAKTYNLTTRRIHSFLEQKDSSTLTPRDILNIDQFTENNTSGDFCYYQVESITPVGVEMVADFTTISDNHTFIANGIVTHNCGIVKNFALLTNISTRTPSYCLHDWFKRGFELIILPNFQPKLIPSSFVVFVNANPIGVVYHPDFDQVIKYVRHMRSEFRRSKQRGELPHDVSMHVDYEAQHIYTYSDPGRCCRPVLVLKKGYDADGKAKMLPVLDRSHIQKLQDPASSYGWDNLIRDGVVEFVDVDEQEVRDFVCAFDLDDVASRRAPFTHCDIHPSAMLSVVSAMIPFPHHNQSPRNTYSDAMSKQAMGIFATNFYKRFDTTAHILYSPSKPLVSTKVAELLKLDKLPSGQNVIVAITAKDGYTQEDAIQVSQSAIDRGMFRSTFYRTYKSEAKKNNEQTEDKFEHPNVETTSNMRNANYDKVDAFGLPDPETTVCADDIIIGKTTANPSSHSAKRSGGGGKRHSKPKKDSSVALRKSENGVIDSVIVTTNADYQKMVKVRVRSIRIPEIGDKLCLTGDHDVLTKNVGWKPISKVTLDDIIATLNSESQQVEWHKPERLIDFEHNGPMYCVKNQQVDLMTTMDHKMYVKPDSESQPSLYSAKDIVGKRASYFRMTAQTGQTAALNIAVKVNVDPLNLDDKVIQGWSGQVYCLDVPNHIFYVRKNGKAVWTGNCSRHGQKGTIGMIVRDEDMPFTANGVTPDIIINSHAIPSRMTIAQLLECVLGKACAINGEFADGTPFNNDFDLDQFTGILRANGMTWHGKETMYNGQTGKMMPTQIFCGPTYYERLKHMVADKQHARATGPIQILTRQPVEGRARGGGLRFGFYIIAEKWNVKILLVCDTAGNASKFRGSLCVIFYTNIYYT